MHLHLLIFLCTLMLISCGSNDSYSESKNEKNIIQKKDTLAISSKVLVEKDSTYHLPIGSPLILEKNIVSDIPIFSNQDTIISNLIEDIIKVYRDSLFMELYIYKKNDKSFERGYYVPEKSLYNYYEFLFVSPKLHVSGISPISRSAYCDSTFSTLGSLLNSLDNITLKLEGAGVNHTFIDSIRCGDTSPIKRVDLVSYNTVGKKLDQLNIYYDNELLYWSNYRFPYIDKLLKINLVYIRYGEEYEYGGIEKWQIKSNGKFVRYYEKEGSFKNEEEQGTVKNSMREGKWIEKKPNALVNKPTYLESYFKEGEPINEWKFYKADYDTLVYKDGFYTREKYIFKKKGKLLYTELYENGELIERQFIE